MLIARQQTYSRCGRAFAGCLLVLLLPLSSMALNDPVDGSDPVVAKVTIRAREFHPSTVTIPVDREVRLIFENEDVELHAFAPSAFLDDIPLQTDGNGAAQFGEHGLVRILIPSGGWAELRFTFPKAGLYNYRCDLPGHQMRALIQVEEQTLSKPVP